MTTLYDRLGGQEAISVAVDRLYQNILADGRIKHFFQGVDMDAQKAKQRAFLTMAFGGPNNYAGKELREAHRHLVARGLNEQHFDAVLGHIEATLKELRVPEDQIAEVIAAAEGARPEVLNR